MEQCPNINFFDYIIKNATTLYFEGIFYMVCTTGNIDLNK